MLSTYTTNFLRVLYVGVSVSNTNYPTLPPSVNISSLHNSLQLWLGLGFCSLVVLALAFLCVASQLLHMRTPCSFRRGDSQIRCGKECNDLMWLSSSVSFRLFVLVFLLPNFPRCQQQQQQQQQSSGFLCIRMILL